jgi:hypothetical protein
MEQSPPRNADTRSSAQETLRHVWITNVHYLFTKFRHCTFDSGTDCIDLAHASL